jgi:hypothetical protein
MDVDGRNAYFYVAGERQRLGTAYIALMVQKRGFVRNAAFATGLLTLMLLAYWIRLGDAIALGGASLTLLVLVPGLFAYLVVRPGEHALARRFLRGMRQIVRISALLPLLGAIALVVNGKVLAENAGGGHVPPPGQKIAGQASGTTTTSARPPRPKNGRRPPAPPSTTHLTVTGTSSPATGADHTYRKTPWTLSALFGLLFITSAGFTVVLTLSALRPSLARQRPWRNAAGLARYSHPAISGSKVKYLQLIDALEAALAVEPVGSSLERLTQLEQRVARADLTTEERQDLERRLGHYKATLEVRAGEGVAG